MEQYKKSVWSEKFSWPEIVNRAVLRRKELKLTQKRVALLANISTPTVSRLKNNDTNIKLSSALAILRVLGI